MSLLITRLYLSGCFQPQYLALNQLELMHSGCGRLLVVVQCAKQLTRVSSESQDTFCSLSLGGQTHVTPVVPSSVNPSWNATMQFIVRDLRQEVLCITVLQRQRFSPNGKIVKIYFLLIPLL